MHKCEGMRRKVTFLPSATKLRRLCFYRRLSVDGGVCLSACWDTTPPSYWNAFLLNTMIPMLCDPHKKTCILIPPLFHSCCLSVCLSPLTRWRCCNRPHTFFVYSAYRMSPIISHQVLIVMVTGGLALCPRTIS